VWSNCIIYNKAIFDDHGVPYPKDGWTWEDFVATAQALRDSPSKSDQKQLAFANWQPASVFGEAYWNLGGRYFASDGLTSMLDSREALQAMQLYYDLVHVHHAIPTVAELTNVSAQGGWGSGGLTIFSREGAAMIIIGRWYIILMPDYPNLRDKLGAVRLPRFPGRPMTGMTDTRAAGVNAMSPHRMEALKFLTYLAGADYSRLIVEDGDSLPPNPLLATSGEALATQTVPDPAFHQPFVDAQRDSRPIDISSFIDAVLIDRWIGERIDQVENKLTSPEDAMRGLAQEVNQTIRRDLEREPRLQRKYKDITGQDYHPDWWKTHKAPIKGGAE
jgi:multiple sugar transport system substrate-binding protein